MLALQIILTIVIVSGLISFVGDRVGHFIGRKRLTIFNLRPRHTAIAITIATGILIALFTGSILFMASADVRTAIFGLDKLRSLISERSRELEKIKTDRETLVKEISEIDKKLKDSKKEIAELTKTKVSLMSEVKTARSGSLLYKVNDIIMGIVIDSTSDKEKNEQKLTNVLSSADSAIKKIVGKGKKHYIVMPEEELNDAADFMTSHPTKVIVRIVSARNVIFGEEIPVHFELFENMLVFKKNDILIASKINGTRSLPEIEQEIKDVLSKVNDIAIEKGIVPLPDGSVGVIPYSQIFDASKKIKSKNKMISFSVESISDIYSAGPLQVNLKIND